MNILIKKIIAIAGIILAVLSIYFGSLLPLVKSKLYIKALNSMPLVKSLGDFKKIFDKPFNFYSPVGDEEITKFLGSNIVGIISNANNQEEVARYLVNYIEPYLFQNNVRHLIMGGQIYSILWKKYGKEADFKKAEEYYLRAMEIGPKLPPVLYGLLDLERVKGNNEKAKEIGETILKYWPEDERVKQIIESSN